MKADTVRGVMALALPLSALLAACGPEPATSAAETRAARPNIVLILMDTLRADRVEATRNGLPVMPFLARMAREGTYYTNAISPCSWTKPAMASIFTGVYPGQHGVTFSARNEDPDHPTSDRLAEGWETLAEWLAGHGYTTWGYQTNANLTRALGFGQGFAEDRYRFDSGAPAAAVTAAALEAFPALPAPFFLYAHYMDPHVPYAPDPSVYGALGPMPDLPEYDLALLSDYERFMAYYLDQAKTAIGLQPAHTIQDLSAAGKEAVRHRYDLECYAMDRAIEALVAAVRTQYPDTVFVFLSDHGEEFWERGGMGHGATLHQEQVHVPFIILDPARPATRDAKTISTLELLPRLAERLGVSRSTAWEPPEGPVLSFTRGPWPSLRVHQSAIFQGRFTLIRDHTRESEALYDLDADPAETADLLAGDPVLGGQLRGMLDANQASAMVNTPPPSTPLSEAEIDALEAIGYLNGGTPDAK